ncbi:MAG TPA: GTPase HflX, partial [Flavobacteriales bacterium]|nr:GTPase HflX [Flavobacteriales bacterium]
MIEAKIESRVDETTILVGVITPRQDELQVKEYLDELTFLAETAGAKVIKTFTQKLQVPVPGT